MFDEAFHVWWREKSRWSGQITWKAHVIMFANNIQPLLFLFHFTNSRDRILLSILWVKLFKIHLRNQEVSPLPFYSTTRSPIHTWDRERKEISLLTRVSHDSLEENDVISYMIKLFDHLQVIKSIQSMILILYKKEINNKKRFSDHLIKSKKKCRQIYFRWISFKKIYKIIKN